MVKTNIQTFTGEVEILSNLHVGPSGSSYLTANGAASNVLDITGNVGATFFVGDGGFLSNIATTLSDIVNQGNVSANVLQFNSTSDYAGVGLVTSSNVGIQNTAPSHTLSIGDKIRVDDNTVETSGQSVIQVDGRILATRFQGDGGLLSNIATTFESIVNQGNVASNVVKFSSDSAYAGAGVITDSNVGIQNTAPTHNLSVGSNLHVNDTGSNVLTVHGNVMASNLNLGIFSITPAYGLNDVCNTSNGTSNVVQFQNATTSLVASSNIVVSGNVTAQSLISTSNTEVGDRLKFSGSNVFVDTLRVSDVASNIVTYDQSTGELTDSGGSFMNKFTMISEQPPSNIFSNVSTGPYTLTTSNLATNSNTFNAFDGTANAWVSGDLAGGYIGGSNVFHETNLTQLSNTHPTQFGDWLAIEFPYKSRLRHMKLTPLTAAQFPDSANIYATNDSVTWTEIGYWKDRNPVTNSNVQTISVNTSEDFNKYALVATKAAGNSSNVAIQDWNLFTESVSVDGGKGVDKRRAATKTFVFTVSNASGANKYYINGVQQSSLQLEQNHTYIFDVSSTTLAGHPLRFSTTATGSEYTTGITNLGTYGGGGTATRTFAVTTDTPTTLYYFCTAHAGMGATMSISPTAELEVSGRIMSRDLVVTGTGGMSIGGGTTTQRVEYPTLGTIRYNTTTGFMEGYAAAGWAPIAQPPTVTGISPLSTLTSGGIGVGWNTGTKIQASDVEASDEFGWSVAISGDGTKAIVGAHYEDTGGNGAGSAYIFAYDGSSWTQEAKIQASDLQSSDYFGNSVAMSGDGTKVIVGAYSEDTTYTDVGAAYIFTLSSGSWSQEAKILASDKEGSDYFGYSVSMNSAATKVIVGAYGEGTGGYNAGSAYIFAYDGSSWTQEAKIQASDIQAGDYFGYSVAMSGDGTKVIVGANLEDTGGSDAGSAYIFAHDGSSWSQEAKIQASDKAASDQFGNSVSMNSAATKVIVGAYVEDTGGSDAGSAYIFAYDGSSWSQEAKIQASDKQSDDHFGYSVSMNSDGTKVITGARYEETGGSDAGAAYIFDYRATELFDTETQVFTATGTGIVSGSTVQLEGANGSLYSVLDATPNAAGTQVTFKMGGTLPLEYPPSAMTNNASITGYVASGSGNYNSLAWKAFDDVVSTGNYWPAGNGSAAGGYSTSSPYLAGSSVPYTGQHHGHWLQLQIPTPVVLSRAVIGSTQSAYQHGQFVILGSNDGTNWTLLHTGTGTSLSTDVTTLSAGSTQAFSYFRVVIKSKTSSTSNYNIELNNVQFFGKTGAFELAQQPYKVRINSTSGLIGTSTAAIGFAVGWTSPAAGGTIMFETSASETKTLVGTDGGGGTNRTFSVAPGSNALPSGLTLTGSTGAITGQIAANQDGVTTSVTFRLTDNTTGLFTDRAINIKGITALYTWSPNPFTFGAARLNGGGAYPETIHADTLYGATLQNFIDKGTYSSAAWRTNTAYFKLGASGVTSAQNGFQLWTVPITGTYTIKAYGANGGGLNASSANSRGGYGAWTQGNFNLTKGEKVLIIVGHIGRDGSSYNYTSSGGGGGTYVLKELGASTAVSNSSIYCIAGGGGGGRDNNSGTNYPGDGIASQAAEITSGGGGSGSANYGSGGGAGYFANGNVPTSTSSGFEAQRPYTGSQGGYGAWSWGSSHGYGNRYGGFGGGGGNGAHDPGGGGGYQGGGGGSFGYQTNPVSQGGTCRNNGIAGTISFGNQTGLEQNGKVIITLI